MNLYLIIEEKTLEAPGLSFPSHKMGHILKRWVYNHIVGGAEPESRAQLAPGQAGAGSPRPPGDLVLLYRVLPLGQLRSLSPEDMICVPAA